MGWWGERIVPRVVDAGLRSRPVGELREAVSGELTGRVLQPGFGSGLDVRFLPPAVTSVGAVEPNDLAWELSEKRRERATVPIDRVGFDGQRLNLATGSYDSALLTFTLCTIPDPHAALREIRRVLQAGSTLAFVEHGLSPNPRVARWQRRLDPLERRVAGGCELSRDPVVLLERAGFQPQWIKTHDLASGALGRPWMFVHYGIAQAGPNL